MNYTRHQRDLMIVMMTEQITNLPAKTTADREIKYTITPAIIDLAKDCNEFEDKLNQVLAINESLRELIRDLTTPKHRGAGSLG